MTMTPMTTNNILNPIDDLGTIHIIGCGAIGSNLAVMLTKLGASKIVLWDFDTVEPHNVTNQSYTQDDIGKSKAIALSKQLNKINPGCKVIVHDEAYSNQRLDGYVFLCVDSIDVRKTIVETNKINRNIKAMFDFRLELQTAQHYATVWKGENINHFLDTMDFTHEEAKENVAVSPCGTSLSVLPTIQTVVSMGVSNFIKLARGQNFDKVIIVDTDAMSICTI